MRASLKYTYVLLERRKTMCDICCEVLKKPITCGICNFTACYKCFSKFMIECTVMPKCMKCEKPWTRKHLVDSFGQYYVSHTYKKKREDVLFDIEKAMLPDTQPIAVRLKQMKQLQREIEKKQFVCAELRSTINRLDMGILNSEFEEFLENRKNLYMQIHEHAEDCRALQSRRDRLTTTSLRNEKKANSLVLKCPSENCRGYVNMRKMECELCSIKMCRECHEVLSKPVGLDKGTPLEHECNPATVASVKLIAKDTRNCPSCKAMIHKIDGCDQMFCTQCHTAFSWRTGEISMGRVHNPHYYEYLRQSGNTAREMGDIPCGGLPRLPYGIIHKNPKYSIIHQRVAHIELYEIPRLQHDLNTVDGNLDLRVMYLNEEIDLVNFKREIYRREKKLEKKREILTILNTFVIVCSDLFRTLLNGGVGTIDEKQFETICKFTNESMIDVSRVYKCVVPVINNTTWEITSVRY